MSIGSAIRGAVGKVTQAAQQAVGVALGVAGAKPSGPSAPSGSAGANLAAGAGAGAGAVSQAKQTVSNIVSGATSGGRMSGGGGGGSATQISSQASAPVTGTETLAEQTLKDAAAKAEAEKARQAELAKQQADQRAKEASAALLRSEQQKIQQQKQATALAYQQQVKQYPISTTQALLTDAGTAVKQATVKYYGPEGEAYTKLDTKAAELLQKGRQTPVIRDIIYVGEQGAGAIERAVVKTYGPTYEKAMTFIDKIESENQVGKKAAIATFVATTLRTGAQVIPGTWEFGKGLITKPGTTIKEGGKFIGSVVTDIRTTPAKGLGEVTGLYFGGKALGEYGKSVKLDIKPQDILSMTKKGVTETIIEPGRGKVTTTTVENIIPGVETIKLKNVPSQIADISIMEKLQGKTVTATQVSPGGSSPFGLFKSTMTVKEVGGSGLVRTFGGDVGFFLAPEELGRKVPYDIAKIKDLNKLELNPLDKPKLPEFTNVQQNVLKNLKDEVLGGSGAGETLFKDFRKHKDLDIISKNPEQTARNIVNNNPTEFKLKKGSEGKYKIIDKKTGEGVADIAPTTLYTKDIFGNVQSVRVDGLNILAPDNFLRIKTITIERAGTTSRVKAAKDISAISEGKISPQDILKPSYKPGAAQAYTYYAGLGAKAPSIFDVISGKAKLGKAGRPSIFINPELKVQSYPKELITKPITAAEKARVIENIKLVREGKFPGISGTPETLAKLADKLEQRGNIKQWAIGYRLAEYSAKYPGTYVGKGAITGIKPEFELTQSVGVKNILIPETFRGKVGKFFSFGETTVRDITGQKFEVFRIKTEVPKASEIASSAIELSSQSLKDLKAYKEFSGISEVSSEFKPIYDVSRLVTSPAKAFSVISSATTIPSKVSAVLSPSYIKDSISSDVSGKGTSEIINYNPSSAPSPRTPSPKPSGTSYPSYTGVSYPSPISPGPSSPKPSSPKPSGTSSGRYISYKPSGLSSISYLFNKPSRITSGYVSEKSTKKKLISKRRSLGFGFDVLIKRKGQFKALGVSLTEQQAGLLAQKRLKMGLGASARLVPTGRAAVESRISKVARPGEFRQYKVSGGRKIFDPRLFIQEKKFRLGTKSEISEIQAAKTAKSGSLPVARPTIDWVQPKKQKALYMPKSYSARVKYQPTQITAEERSRMILPEKNRKPGRYSSKPKIIKSKRRNPIIW